MTMSEADPLVRVRLDLSYDGTEFAGWAIQPDRRTVQGVVQAALATVWRLPSVSLTVAGRTDAGVHATGQVTHVDVPASVWTEAQDRLIRGLAGLLPADVRVRQAVLAPPEFDARYSALWRRYEYRICDAESGPDPLRRHCVLAWRRALDDAAMAEAAQRLRGLHNFVAYCRKRDGATTIRTVQSFDVRRCGDEIVCTVQADAFCHSMVRSLVGALTLVGEGRRPPDWPASLLEQDVRAGDVPVAPAHGLTLLAVGYPPDDELAARNEQTRAKRVLSPESPR